MTTASCGGTKVRYPSWSRAESAAKDLRRRKSAHAMTYSCQDCGGFHVGNGLGPGRLGARLRKQKLNRILERELRA